MPDVPGYRITQWDNEGPASLVESFAEVLNSVRDAPGADLQIAESSWDVAKVRTWERESTVGRQRLMVTAAVAEGSGEVVGATVCTLDEQSPTRASQHDTAVLPAHRGVGLGYAIKHRQAMLLCEQAGLETVSTTVNVDNHPMMAVNRRLGYRTAAERVLVQVDA